MKKKKEPSPSQLTGKQFKALIERAHDGVVLYGADGRIRYATPAVAKITGFALRHTLGKKWESFMHPADAGGTRKAVLKLLKQPGKSITLIHRVKHRTGTYRWIESRLTNHVHIAEIGGIVSNFRDITAIRLAEERGRRAQGLLETINQNVSEGIFMGILGKQFIYANDAFLKITGFRNFAELEKIRPEKIFSEKSIHKEVVHDLKRTGSLRDRQVILRRRNGDAYWGVLNVTLLEYEGKAGHFVGTLRDITKEKQAEVQLIESRNFFNNILNTVAAPVFIKDEKHRWIMCNDSFCDLVGKPREQILGKSDPDFLSPGEAKVFWKADNETLRTGNTGVNEEVLTRHGKTHYLLTVKSRYINDKGDKFIIGFITDITHLRRAEQEIKHLNENLEGVLESSDESIFSVDNNLNYTAFNQRHKKIMSMLYNADIGIGKNKMRFLRGHRDSRWVKAELLRALTGEHFVSEHYQDFEKYQGYIQTTYNPIRGDNDEVKGVAVFVQDITDRKRYEQIINAINANLEGVMESTSDGIVALDRKFTVTLFNNSFAKGFHRLFGGNVSRGARAADVVPGAVWRKMKGHVEKALSGDRTTVEETFPDDQILETSFNPIVDHHGMITGATVFVKNITNRKQIEQRNRALNEELTQQNKQLARQEESLKAALKELSDRNFELDQLMYKTSHDLRSPLSSIIGLVNLAHLDNDPSTFRDYLSKIDGRARKLDEFIRSMLDYARVNRMEADHEEVDLLALVSSCLSELEHMDLTPQMKTIIDIDPLPARIKSDKLRLKIIVSNIVSNAFKYRNTDVESFLKIRGLASGGAMVLSFEDNGIGIKEEHRAKIFNMFYRATDKSQGSGLGMYIVKQAVEKLRGKIDLTSEYGKGTRITITLPNNT